MKGKFETFKLLIYELKMLFILRVEVISNSAIIQSLEELNLNFLSVNEQSVIKLVSNSKKLEKLHLHCCYNIKKFDDIRNAANKTIKNLVIDY